MSAPLKPPTAVSLTSVAPENPGFGSTASITTNDSLLENLPPEVMLELLSHFDIESLSTIVHASPIFHQLYLLNRKTLLCKAMTETLQDIVPDAIAAYESSSDDFKHRCTTQVVKQFIQDRYQPLREQGRQSLLNGNIQEKQIIDMASFHISTIQPLTNLYSQWAQNKLPETPKPLSVSERMRMSRAMYRFHLHCNLFGTSSLNYQPRLKRVYFRPEEILNLLFCKYAPWEVEEIICFSYFAHQFYDDVFQDIHGDIPEPDSESDLEDGLETDNVFDLDFNDEWNWDELLHGTLLRGLDLLRTVSLLRKPADHQQLVSVMLPQICLSTCPNLNAIFEFSESRAARRRSYPMEGDEKELRREPLHFTGDDANGPPQAWTIIWKETYSNIYGYAIPNAMHQWGYIMWDAERLQLFNGREMLERQWKDRWRDSDPRSPSSGLVV